MAFPYRVRILAALADPALVTPAEKWAVIRAIRREAIMSLSLRERIWTATAAQDPSGKARLYRIVGDPRLYGVGGIELTLHLRRKLVVIPLRPDVSKVRNPGCDRWTAWIHGVSFSLREGIGPG